MTCSHAFGLIQLTPGFPLGPCLSPGDFPQFRKAFHIMPPYHGRTFTHVGSVPHLLSFEVPRLSPEHQTAFPRPQRLDYSLTDLHLVVPAEKM